MIIYFIEDGFLSSYGIRKYLLSHMRLFSLKNSHCYRLFLLYLLESYFKDWNFSPEFRKKQLISSENWEIISGPATIYIFTDVYKFNSLIGSRGIFTPQRDFITNSSGWNQAPICSSSPADNQSWCFLPRGLKVSLSSRLYTLNVQSTKWPHCSLHVQACNPSVCPRKQA